MNVSMKVLDSQYRHILPGVWNVFEELFIVTLSESGYSMA